MPATKKIEIEYGGGKKIIVSEDEAQDIYESLNSFFTKSDYETNKQWLKDAIDNAAFDHILRKNYGIRRSPAPR